MTSNHTPRRASAATERGRRDDSPAAKVVLVADSEPSVTDRIASLLRDSYSVRTAYSGDALLESIDTDVGVVLFDPSLPDASTDDVVARIAASTVECRIAAIADGAPTAADVFDDYVVKPIAPDALRSTVDRLSRQASYRSKLERYYDLVTERAAAEGDREDLDERLDRLRGELDEVLGSLDQRDAYYAALRELDDEDY